MATLAAVADIDAAAGASTNAAGAGATVVADLAAATVIRSITSGAAVAARIGAAFVAEIGAAVVADIRAAASAPSANYSVKAMPVEVKPSMSAAVPPKPPSPSAVRASVDVPPPPPSPKPKINTPESKPTNTNYPTRSSGSTDSGKRFKVGKTETDVENKASQPRGGVKAANTGSNRPDGATSTRGSDRHSNNQRKGRHGDDDE